MATERTVLVRLKADSGPFVRQLALAEAAVRSLGNEIDTTNDRTAWLAQSILALGPALVPLGAAATPVLAGLATQLGIAASAGGVLALAFVGIGDALKKLNDYQLDPTAENLAKVREEFTKIGPDGANFVTFLDDIAPKFRDLQMISREGIFPGAQEGIESFMRILPRVRIVVGQLADGIGELMADAGAGISGPGFTKFFDFLERNAKPILIEMGHTLGNFVEGIASMIAAFEPLTLGFSSGFEDMSRAFADWADGLDTNQGFQGFLAYVQESTPKVLDFVGSLVEALAAIVQAAAPVGDVMLPLLSRLLDVIGAIADTPLGPIFLTAAAGMAAYGRAVALASITTGGMFSSLIGGFKTADGQAKAAIPRMRDFGNAMLYMAQSNKQLDAMSGWNSFAAAQGERAKQARRSVLEFGKAIGPTAAAIGGLTLATTGAADGMGITNTASLALMGTFISPGFGTAVGGAAGLMLDYKSATDKASNITSQLRHEVQAAGLDFAAMDTAVKKAFQGIQDLGDDVQIDSFKDIFDIDPFVDVATGSSGREAAAKAAADAQADLEAKAQGITELARQLGQEIPQGMTLPLDELTEVAVRAAPAMQALGYDLNKIFDPKQTSPDEMALFARVIADFVKDSDSAGGRTKALSDAIGGLNDQVLTTAQSASVLATALDAILGPELGVSEATDAWVIALRTLNGEISHNNRTLVGNSKQALQNRAAIRDRVVAMQDVLNAEAEAGASSQKLSRHLRQQRQALIDAGAAAGLSRGELKAYLNELGLTPKLVKTIIDANTEPGDRKRKAVGADLKRLQETVVRPTVDLGTGPFMGAIAAVRNALTNIPDETVFVNVKTTRTGGGIHGSVESNSAYGNVFPGDVANGHVPEMYRGGHTRIWGEPETHGESYIPHADDARRPRAKQILEQTAQMFGGQVEWFANGGFKTEMDRWNQRASSSSSAAQRLSVDMSGFNVTGTLQTPWGPAQIEGIAERAAVRAVNNQTDMTGARARTNYRGVADAD